MAVPPPQRVPLAVVGLGALFPGSSDAGGFWRDILAGRDLIGDVPPTHWLVEDYYSPDPSAPDKTYVRRGAFLSPVEFDPLEHGIPPSIVPATDTAQLLALVVARQVLDDARDTFAKVDRERVSVILGTSSAQELVTQMASRLQRPIWVKALREHGLPEDEVQAVCDRIAGHYVPWQESTFPGLLGNVIAGRIANRMDLGGTNCVTDAACASSLAALSMAAYELWAGDSDLVITGGVETVNDIFMYACFSKTPALSATEDCRPFSDDADGTMLGEGLGMLALRRLSDAERDGDRIYAVVRGIGASSDGRAKSIYAPVASGQARALRRAYAAAGYGPETVELVEAHGTATKAGDAAEYEGLRAVFEASGRTDRQWCALGSVKSQLGHTKSAAGAAGLFKAILAVHHKTLPPTIKVRRPSPELRIEEGAFYLNTETRPWIRGGDHPRRASASSFGFGGSNFHVAVEEYTGPGARARRFRSFPTELVLLSGATPAALAGRSREVSAQADGPGALARIAWKSQGGDEGARHEPARLAVVAADEADLQAKLERAAAAIEQSPDSAFDWPAGVHYAPRPLSGPVAFLFPGQGSQYVGMGSALALAFDAARAVWDAAAQGAAWEGTRLADVVFPRPAFSDEEREAQAVRLTRTEWAQPAIGVASAAVLALLDAAGVRPMAVAGHSFGEVTALFAAGALDLEGLVRVARARGELMASAASRPGAMLAVFHDVEELGRVLDGLAGDVVVANYNAPRQAVLSGPAEAIAAVEARLASQGVSARRLPVSTAFHSSLVAPSVPRFAEFLEGVPIAAPGRPVVAGADAAVYGADAGAVRAGLAAQIAAPVRFAQQVEALYAAGVRTFVEVGPGAVLTGLVGECLHGREHLAVAFDRRGQHGVTAAWSALGRLIVAGVAVDLGPLWKPYLPLPEPAKRKAGHTLKISGANYGKLYPPPGGAAALPPPNPPRPAPSPAAVAPPIAAPHASSGDGVAWAQAFQDVQRQTAEAHACYQRAMADAHMAFLRSAEVSLATLGAMMNGQEVALPSAAAAPALAVSFEAAPASAPPAPSASGASPAPVAAPPSILPPVVAAVAGPAPAAPRAVKDLLLAVVSEKTGYPAEMLGLEMHVEADLGIDSIKRVEILSAIQERAPGLPPVRATDLADLKTLGQIVAFLEGGSGPPPARVAPPPAGAAPKPAFAAPRDEIKPSPDTPAKIRRLVVREVVAPAAGFATPGLFDGPIVLTGDAGGVAAELAVRLRSHGIAAEVGSGPSDDVAGVVFLGALGDITAREDAFEVAREAFGVARNLARGRGSRPGLFVTVQDTGGDFGLSGRVGDRAWLGGLPGLAKTVAREWPEAAVKAIDLERAGRPAAALAEALARELLGGGPEREVGLRADGCRITLALAEEDAPLGKEVVDSRSVLVATGGARGVTAACLLALARRARPRLALLGRTPLEDEAPGLADAETEVELTRRLAAGDPSADPATLRAAARGVLAAREVRATMAALHEAGSEAVYVPVDVRDTRAVAEACRMVREKHGPITAVVHGAGVIADRSLAEKTDAAFDLVFDTKVRSLHALLEATANDPLRLVCCFSSVAGRFGNAGQSDYAMANATLSAVAAAEAARRGGACVVRSIEWGPWDGGMVDAGLKAHFEREGLPLIGLEEGAARFAAELTEGTAPAIVVVGGPPPLPAKLREQRFELVVDSGSHPFLRSHRVQDVPVLPVVLVVEWFSRAAALFRPGLRLAALRELAVLSGLLLDAFEGDGHRLTVVCRETANGAAPRVLLELRGAQGRLHYSALAELVPPGEDARPPGGVDGLERLEAWPSGRAIYGPPLFQGPDFQVLEAVEGLSLEGAAALLRGSRDVGWAGGPWTVDPAVLEGGLQLAQLWGFRALGALTLPTRIGAFVPHRINGDGAGPTRCLLRASTVGDLRTVSSAAFLSATGNVIAELRDVEMHVVVTGAGERPAAPAAG